MDPRTRLQRPIPGQSLCLPRPVADGAHRRAEAPAGERPVRPEWRDHGIAMSVRPAARIARAEPNAPQLFRLVRHPFRLDVTRPARSAYDFTLAPRWRPAPKIGHGVPAIASRCEGTLA